MIKLAHSSILTAFEQRTIGTKVINNDTVYNCTQGFSSIIGPKILAHNFSTDRIPGQAVIHVPEAAPYISGGMGRNRDNPNDYVLRSHRGKVSAYLKREFAEPVLDCRIIVYTLEAYLNDPDIDEDPKEAGLLRIAQPTHVLVAILADSGVPSTLSPYRFVKNLAGGNHEALDWSADEIRAKAREIAAGVDGWNIVAD